MDLGRRIVSETRVVLTLVSQDRGAISMACSSIALGVKLGGERVEIDVGTLVAIPSRKSKIFSVDLRALLG